MFIERLQLLKPLLTCVLFQPKQRLVDFQIMLLSIVDLIKIIGQYFPLNLTHFNCLHWYLYLLTLQHPLPLYFSINQYRQIF